MLTVAAVAAVTATAPPTIHATTFPVPAVALKLPAAIEAAGADGDMPIASDRPARTLPALMLELEPDKCNVQGPCRCHICFVFNPKSPDVLKCQSNASGK